MYPVQKFAFEKTALRVVLRDDEAWFVGVDVCAALELSKPENALARLDDDEKYTLAEGVICDQRGPRARLVVSEPGVYRLVFGSRKPSAERFKRWLAHEVLPEIRRSGRFVPKGVHNVDPFSPAQTPSDHDPRAWPVIQKLQCVQLCARVHGRLRAEAMWRQVGLPAVPPPPVTALDEARICLRHLLDSPAYGEGPGIRDLIEAALDDDETARATLLGAGIRVFPERDAFMVANGDPALSRLFATTDWSHGRYQRVLRRLPGTASSGTSRFGGVNRRGTLIPAAYLDEDGLMLAASDTRSASRPEAG